MHSYFRIQIYWISAETALIVKTSRNLWLDSREVLRLSGPPSWITLTLLVGVESRLKWWLAMLEPLYSISPLIERKILQTSISPPVKDQSEAPPELFDCAFCVRLNAPHCLHSVQFYVRNLGSVIMVVSIGCSTGPSDWAIYTRSFMCEMTF